MTIYMYIATFAWAFLVFGYSKRSIRHRHVPLMVMGIVTDFLLVGYLQYTRSAIQTAVAFTLGPLQMTHIILSTIALILYFPTIYLGIRLYRGDESIRAIHRKVASSALIFRTAGFIFMFSMMK